MIVVDHPGEPDREEVSATGDDCCKGFRIKAYRAMRMRELFQEAYKMPDSQRFERALALLVLAGSHSRLEPMKKVGKTIKRHWIGIMNWFKHKESNGILESLNYRAGG